MTNLSIKLLSNQTSRNTLKKVKIGKYRKIKIFSFKQIKALMSKVSIKFLDILKKKKKAYAVSLCLLQEKSRQWRHVNLMNAGCLPIL